MVQEQGVSDMLRKAVVFQSPTITVKAIYKGRLLSSLANATSAGNQRRLANAQGATLYNNVFYLVYEPLAKFGSHAPPTAAQVGNPTASLMKARTLRSPLATSVWQLPTLSPMVRMPKLKFNCSH